MIARFRSRGQTCEVEVAAGESLMNAAVKSGVSGIEGECGGEMSCATCHVHVEPDWLRLLEPQSEAEVDLLELVDDLQDNSRLACQIAMTQVLDGISVEVPG
jgi:2Fe-2S ferredoxin